METYKFTGFAPETGCYMQGALQAVVTGPANRRAAAACLANLMANGASRKSAAEYMEVYGKDFAKGLRVLSFGRVQ